jgi:cyanophycin synthetase
MPLRLPDPVQIAYYRLERLVTRPVRNLVFGRFWKRNVLIAKVTGSYGKTTTSRMLAAVMKAAGHTVGLSCSDGIVVDGRQMPGTGRSCYYGARRVFRYREVTAAVLECTVGGEVLQGQYIPRCHAAALLNVSDMHNGQYGLETVEDTARIKQSIVATSLGPIVINLDDPHCAALARSRNGSLITGFSMEPANPALFEVLKRGGRAITLDGDGIHIVLLSKSGDPEVLARLDAIPDSAGGIARHVAANAMAAAGLAQNLGASSSAVRIGLEDQAFATHFRPRFSVIAAPQFTLVLDKALGPVALEAGVRSQQSVEAAGTRVAVLSAPEATTCAMLEKMAAIVAGKFNRFVCHDAIADRYAQALLRAAVPEGAICVRRDIVAACIEARANVQDDGLVYVQVAYPQHHDAVRSALGIE